MEFREFFKSYDADSWKPIGFTIPTPPIGGMPAQWTGSQSLDMPSVNGGYAGTSWTNAQDDLGLPSVTKTGIIKFIDFKKSPVYVVIQDSEGKIHRLWIPQRIIRRLQPEPALNRTLTVVFGRRPEDTSEAPTQIKSIKCF